MQHEEAWRPVATRHAEDLVADERAIQNRLRWFTLFSGCATILGIVAPILAGFTAASVKWAGSGEWSLATSVLTLAASAGVALHKGLDCDRYHAKCHQALAALRALASAYDRLLSGALTNVEQGFEALEARLDRFYQDYAEVAPLRPTHISGQSS